MKTSDTVTVSFKGALQSKAAEPVIPALAQVLATAYSLSALAQNAHWNVEGATFEQLHEMFGEIYDGLTTKVDDIAERIRQLGGYVQVDLAAFQQASGIAQPSAPQGVNDWVSAILAGHEKMISDWMAVEKITGDVGMLEVQDLALAQNQDLMKTAWMLRSLLKG